MTLHDLKLRLRALVAPRRAERDLDDELAFHVEREAHRLVADGVDPDEARRRARARFGSMTVAADACRDERGTTWIDGVVRDVRYAFRSYRRAPGVALTIVTTVALGLGLVAVAFTLLNHVLFRVDHVRDPHGLVGIERARTPNGDRPGLTHPDYESLVRHTSVFTDVFAMLPDIDSRIDGRMMSGTLVTGTFFQTLGVRPALGRMLIPEDDDPSAGRRVVVLSHRGWTRHFSNDPGIVGRTLIASGVPFQIVGVMPEDFRGLMVTAPDYWAPWSQLGYVRPIHLGRENRVAVEIVGRLKSGLSRSQALAALNAWGAGTAGAATPADRSRSAFVLLTRDGTYPWPSEAFAIFSPLFFAFGLILLIGCANVANLLLARGVRRQREIGVRLALGASRRRVVRQLFTESLLLALVSATLAFALSRIVLTVTTRAVMATWPPDIGDVAFTMPPADWRVAAFLVSGAFLSTFFFALLPALRATRVGLVRAMRGEIVRDARPGRTRAALIAIQVTASALLLICSAVFLRSALAAATVDPGIRTADTVFVDVVNEDKRPAMLDNIRRAPFVTAIAASSPDILGRPRQAVALGPAGRTEIAYKFVSREYFDVLGIDMLRGRTFAENERTADAAVTIVSESVARELWPGRDALGETLRLDPDANPDTRDDVPTLRPRAFLVVGVARDVAGFRLADFKEAGVYMPIGPEGAEAALTVRVQGDPENARRALLDRLTVVDPNMGQVITLRTVAGIETYLLRIAFWITLVLGSLALVLTLSGLFGVLSFLVEQRTKEIGVRMALGASRQRISTLVLSQMAWPVGLGVLAGSGLAVALGAVLLSTPAADRIAATFRLFDPVAYSASIVCVIVACVVAALVPTLRAGRVNPATTLRRD